MIRFFQRPYPSANAVLLCGPCPILVDTGFGADAAALFDWLGEDRPVLILNTHAHSDHAGGNRALQRRFDAEIAAGAADAARAGAGHPDLGGAHWLQQPIEPYRVDRALAPGDVLDTGAAEWEVLATPGHTRGHLSLVCRAAGVAVLGDSLHDADLGWLDPREPGALSNTAATLAAIGALGLRTAYSGHGAAILDPAASVARARRRLAAWQADPRLVGWHACKRIFAHALILEDGIAASALEGFLLRLPWFADHARLVFGLSPEAFVAPLLDEMLRADAAWWDGGVLRARAARRAPVAVAR